MATIIKFKRRAVAGGAGAPSALKSGEPAYNDFSNILYYGFGDDGGGNATSVIPIGGSGAAVMLTGAQTVAGAKTFSTAPLSSVAASAGTELVRKTEHDADLALKAPLASPTFTGTAAAPTPAGADSTTKIATTGWVQGEGFGRLTNRLDQFAAPNVDLSIGSHKLINVTDPTAATDAATKGYVDALMQGLQWKQPVRAATTAAITLSAPQTVDGVAVIAGDRVLVKNQASALTNGIYLVAAGAWTRALDFDASAEALDGAAMLVAEGTVNNGVTFALTTNAPIVLNTTALVFTQITGGAAGEANTTSNVGTGQGLAKAKSGVDLPFKSLLGTAGDITLTGNTNDVTFSLPSIDGGTF